MTQEGIDRVGQVWRRKQDGVEVLVTDTRGPSPCILGRKRTKRGWSRKKGCLFLAHYVLVSEGEPLPGEKVAI